MIPIGVIVHPLPRRFRRTSTTKSIAARHRLHFLTRLIDCRSPSSPRDTDWVVANRQSHPNAPFVAHRSCYLLISMRRIRDCKGRIRCDGCPSITAAPAQVLCTTGCWQMAASKLCLPRQNRTTSAHSQTGHGFCLLAIYSSVRSQPRWKQQSLPRAKTMDWNRSALPSYEALPRCLGARRAVDGACIFLSLAVTHVAIRAETKVNLTRALTCLAPIDGGDDKSSSIGRWQSSICGKIVFGALERRCPTPCKSSFTSAPAVIALRQNTPARKAVTARANSPWGAYNRSPKPIQPGEGRCQTAAHEKSLAAAFSLSPRHLPPGRSYP